MITSFFFVHAQGRNLRRHEKFGPASSKRLQAPYGAGWLSSSPRRGERNWFEVNDVVVFVDSSIRTVFKRNEPLVRQQDSLHEIFRFDREAREPRSHRCGRCSDLRLLKCCENDRAHSRGLRQRGLRLRRKRMELVATAIVIPNFKHSWACLGGAKSRRPKRP